MSTIPQELQDWFNEQANPKDYIYLNKLERVNSYLKKLMHEKGLKHKDLVNATGSSKAEVSRWLNKPHNFTLYTIALLEAALGESLLEVPDGRQEELAEQLKAVCNFKFKLKGSINNNVDFNFHYTSETLNFNRFKAEMEKPLENKIDVLNEIDSSLNIAA